jgi:hypothetical protein
VNELDLLSSLRAEIPLTGPSQAVERTVLTAIAAYSLLQNEAVPGTRPGKADTRFRRAPQSGARRTIVVLAASVAVLAAAIGAGTLAASHGH